MEWDSRSFVITSIIFTVLLFVLLFFGLPTPYPLPAEQGILIDFGEDEQGFGEQAPGAIEQVESQPVPSVPETVTSDAEESLETQDVEDAPAVATKPKETKPKTQTTVTKTTVKEEPKEEKPVLNPNANFAKVRNNINTGSDGSATGEGDYGNKNGQEDSMGQSLASGTGGGPQALLQGRSSISLPLPSTNQKKEGKVVVLVIVDRSGKVIFADPGKQGSTTLDKDLLEAAKKAALASKFNRDDNASERQTGTITYVFRFGSN